MPTVIKHVRDVNNFIRTQITQGKDLTNPEDRDAVIKSFLKECTTTTGKMTPELFLFFLQKVNAHALYEQFDNSSYTIVFPTYIPFDVVEMAAKYGYPNIIKKVERNLLDRSKQVGTTKTAALAFRELGGADYMDKVASLNSSATDDKKFKAIREELEFDKQAELRDLKLAAGQIYWTYGNLEDFTKLESFKFNKKYTKLFKEIGANTPIMGMKDKTASLREFNKFTAILDKIIEKENR